MIHTRIQKAHCRLKDSTNATVEADQPRKKNQAKEEDGKKQCAPKRISKKRIEITCNDRTDAPDVQLLVHCGKKEKDNPNTFIQLFG